MHFQQIPKWMRHALIPHEHNQYHPHVLRKKTLHGAAIAMAGLKFALVATLYLVYPDPSAFAEITTLQVYRLTNETRISQGQEQLMLNSSLSEAARKKGEHMLSKQYFNHYGPDGTSPWQWIKGEGYVYTWAGENLAMNFTESSSVMDAWMASEKHRANILNSHYKDVGLAAVTGEFQGRTTTILVQMFGQTNVAQQPEFVKNELKREESSLQTGPKLEVAGEQIVAEVKELNRFNPLGFAIQSSETIFLGVLVFFIIALLLNIFIHIRIQRGHVIMQTLFVIMLLAGIALVKFHWLEFLTQGLKII